MDASTGYIVSSDNNFLLINHLLRDTFDNLWLFYLTPDGVINCGKSEDIGKTWSNPTALANEVTGPFSVALDQNNGIHLCAIRKFNQLTYLQCQDDQWSAKILPLDTRSGQPFSPIVHVNQTGFVNIICGFRKTTNAWSVKHYLIHPRENQFARIHYDVPFASDLCLNISTGKGYSEKYISFLCGAVESDAQDNLHLVHRYFDGQYFQLYYSFYNFKDNQWDSPLPLINDNGNCGIPAIAIDRNNKPHILWVTAKAQKFSLNYRANSVFWQPQINLFENSEIIFSPVLIPWKEEIAVCWHERGETFYLPVNNFSDMDRISILTCPKDTRNIKLHPQVWQTGTGRVLPVTFARKENGHYLLYFTSAFLPEEKTSGDDTRLNKPQTTAVDTDIDTEPGGILTEDQLGQVSEEPEVLMTAGSDLDHYTNLHNENDDVETKYPLIERISTAEVEVVTVGSKLITWRI
ncbi:MAG: hypothetical protein PHO01_07850 [Desulfotomaculaceae bacterium]|nr:hypothetical protein [Desulfotomaculaceae bacterium]